METGLAEFLILTENEVWILCVSKWILKMRCYLKIKLLLEVIHG